MVEGLPKERNKIETNCVRDSVGGTFVRNFSNENPVMYTPSGQAESNLEMGGDVGQRLYCSCEFGRKEDIPRKASSSLGSSNSRP